MVRIAKAVRKIFIMLVLMSIPSDSLLLSAHASGGDGKNLVVNGGFEQGLWQEVYPKDNFFLDKEVYHSGKASCRVVPGTEEDVFTVRYIPVEPDHEYSLSIYIKTDGCSTDDGASVNILFVDVDSDFKALGWFPTGEMKAISTGGTHEWKKFTVIVNSPSNADKLGLYLRVDKGMTGAAWFDDIEVMEINITPKSGEDSTVNKVNDKLLNQIKNLTEVTTSLKFSMTNVEEKGIDCSYQKTALTVAENFLKYAEQDIKNKETKKAQDAIQEIDLMLEKAKRDLEKMSSGKYIPPQVPMYLTSPVKIDGPSFIASTKTFSGKTEIRPVFFNGYGFFSQVRNDIEKFPGYGTNIIQIEFGPVSVFPSEGNTSNRAVEDFLKVADRAAANNIAIDLLLSPHYFPEWALNKYPHLKDCSGGSPAYCIDAPEGRKIEEGFLRYVIPRIKNCPALLSVCLSNEPSSKPSSKCEFTKKMWKEWLQKKHRSIQILNNNYNTNYSSFEDVPVPGPELVSEPIYYDWSIFNAEKFAGWHKWMADIIHEIAPNLPVHAKIMIDHSIDNNGTVGWGIDPELFGKLSQINGNDIVKRYTGGESERIPIHWYTRDREYANGWIMTNMAYDLQRSVADKPIFNSENHLIHPDGDWSYVPPVHIRNVLWQGAIHGQSATTIWVWERTPPDEEKHIWTIHPFTAHIMHRPACAQMVGITNLDLLRFSKEVTAIQKLEPQILLLHSTSSQVYFNQYFPLLQETYEILNFGGLKLGFVTERQLAAGKLPGAKVIVISGATHITDTSFSGLKNFIKEGGKVIFLGEKLLSYNEYNKPRNEKIEPFLKIDHTVSKEEMFIRFLKMIPELGLWKPIELISEDGGPVWGVEYLVSKDKDRLIVNVVNYKHEAKSVKVLLDGKPVSVKNIFNGDQLEIVDLNPLEPMLMEIKYKSVGKTP